MTVTLSAIRSCFEGTVPSAIATCAADGTPNVALLSQVHYVDDEHVALSFQFFNKTRENVLANPRAVVQVMDPVSGAHFRLHLEYLRTETDGPLFENMKAKLAGIASHAGMSKVFHLRGSDVYRVHEAERVFGESAASSRHSAPSALRACSQRIGAATDLAGLFDETLAVLGAQFDIGHAMLLLRNESGDRLYTVASRGYPQSGVGSEILMGEGIIGVAARERTPIRIGHMAQEYLYSRAVRERFRASETACDLETEIPLPGLPASHSQLAVPIALGSRLLGMLYVESPEDLRFTYEDEDALCVIADHLAFAIRLFQEAAHEEGPPATPRPRLSAARRPWFGATPPITVYSSTTIT